MAILKVVAVRDRALDSFGQPVFVRALGQAIRSFSDEVNSKESAMFAHPEDYDLYELAEFDEDRGEFNPMDPRMIAVGKDCSKQA